MKKNKNWYIYILSLIIVIVIGYWWLWWFTNFQVLEQEMNWYTVVYISFTGNMFQFHPAVERLEKMIEWKHIEQQWKLSIYYDLHTDKRSPTSENNAGIIIAHQDVEKLDENSPDYKIMSIPAGKKMVINFPYKSPYSCMIGHIRWTKQMHKYLKAHDNEYAPVIELYNKKDNTIYYITDVKK